MKKNQYSINKKTVYAIICIKRGMNHKQLMNYFDCGYYTVDAILRELCKEKKLIHEDIFTKSGFKDSHLFITRRGVKV